MSSLDDLANQVDIIQAQKQKQAKELKEKIVCILRFCTDVKDYAGGPYSKSGRYDHLALLEDLSSDHVQIYIEGEIRTEKVFAYGKESSFYRPGKWEDELDTWYAKAVEASYDLVIEELLLPREEKQDELT